MFVDFEHNFGIEYPKGSYIEIYTTENVLIESETDQSSPIPITLGERFRDLVVSKTLWYKMDHGGETK